MRRSDVNFRSKILTKYDVTATSKFNNNDQLNVDIAATFDSSYEFPNVFVCDFLSNIYVTLKVGESLFQSFNGRRIYPFNKGLRIYGGGVPPPF